MISIDVGSSHIKAALITGKAKGIRLSDCVLKQIEDPVFDSDGLLKKDVLEQYIKPMLSYYRDRDVAITFSSLPTISNEYTLPFEPNPRKRLEMIKAKVFQTISPHDYLMDYYITSVFNEEKDQENVTETNNNDNKAANKKDKRKKSAPKRMCNVITYIVPRAVVTESRSLLTKLGKKPVCFSVAQNGILNFAKTFLSGATMIIANVNATTVTAHLLNLPDSIITRSANVAQTGGGLDVLASIAGPDPDAPPPEITELADIMTKLVQYQSIKHPGKPVECVYLIGDTLTDDTKSTLLSYTDVPVKNVDEICFRDVYSAGCGIRSLAYVVGAVL